MKNTLITIAALMMLATPAMADQANDLITKEEHFDGMCRGTDNNDACIERQKLMYRLTQLGWCFGKNSQEATYQYRWHRCGPDSMRATVETLHSYDKAPVDPAVAASAQPNYYEADDDISTVQTDIIDTYNNDGRYAVEKIDLRRITSWAMSGVVTLKNWHGGLESCFVKARRNETTHTWNWECH